MKFSLIICTYHRLDALNRLLESVRSQTALPTQIIIVDGSIDAQTADQFQKNKEERIEYYKVGKEYRGLTKQRNFGVSKVDISVDVISFLDDDTVLEPTFFEEVMKVYNKYPEAVGVSGYITNEVIWKKIPLEFQTSNRTFTFDGWMRENSMRFRIRKILGLSPDVPPGFMPQFSHGYALGFIPPSGKTYEVEMLMGGITSYKRSLFEKLLFSSYFEGYGLYEDADFSIRASRKGKLFVNTLAKVEHHHDPGGRPNPFKYGKMVLRNGWYVWRVKEPNPSAKAQIKWNAISFLLTLIRLGNGITDKNAFMEALGRIWGWWSLILKKPMHEN